MSIRSFEIPQADVLADVVATVVAVNNGAVTFADIAAAIGKVERQGRYYRLAAELLGFITNQNNNAAITPRGQTLVAAPTIQNPVLISAVMNMPIAQSVISFLELHHAGVTRAQFTQYMTSISPPGIGASMIPRRVSTIVAWLEDINVITVTAARISLQNILPAAVPILDVQDEAPIVPTTASLQEYETVEERTENARRTGLITIYRDEAAMERANQNHTQLVNLVAERIRNANGIPKRNKFIDLATTLTDEFIFEMKSTTATNVQAQIRKGVSQLYEYRFLQGNPDAKLVLVIQNPLTADEEWFKTYLEQDRDIHLVWDGDGNNLYSTDQTRPVLPFLNLQ